MTNVINIADRLRPLPCPVPPNLETVIGYFGDARYVGFYWIAGADEIVWDDGRTSSTGDPYGWIGFARHDVVRSSLLPINYGSSDTDAEYWLILDTINRTFRYGLPSVVKRTLCSQHKQSMMDDHPILMSEKDFEDLAKSFDEKQKMNWEGTEREHQFALAEKADMMNWLDALKNVVLNGHNR